MKFNLTAKKPSILIIDDDEDHVILIRHALKSYLEHFDVSVASNGLEALNIFQKKIQQNDLFDLVLLDINMPLMDGYDFLKKIRMEESTCFIPVIVLTTTDSLELLTKAYLNGANTVIQKEKMFDPSNNVAKVLIEYWYNVAYIPRNVSALETNQT